MPDYLKLQSDPDLILKLSKLQTQDFATVKDTEEMTSLLALKSNQIPAPLRIGNVTFHHIISDFYPAFRNLSRFRSEPLDQMSDSGIWHLALRIACEKALAYKGLHNFLSSVDSSTIKEFTAHGVPTLSYVEDQIGVGAQMWLHYLYAKAILYYSWLSTNQDTVLDFEPDLTCQACRGALATNGGTRKIGAHCDTRNSSKHISDDHILSVALGSYEVAGRFPEYLRFDELGRTRLRLQALTDELFWQVLIKHLNSYGMRPSI